MEKEDKSSKALGLYIAGDFNTAKELVVQQLIDDFEQACEFKSSKELMNYISEKFLGHDLKDAIAWKITPFIPDNRQRLKEVYALFPELRHVYMESPNALYMFGATLQEIIDNAIKPRINFLKKIQNEDNF